VGLGGAALAHLGRVSRAFVTGGHGLLGTWLVKALLVRGDDVTIFQRGHGDPGASPLALEGLLASVEVVAGDVRDGPGLARAIAARPLDSVFHLAGQAIVGVAQRSPRDTFETNVAGTWRLLEACREAGVGRVIVASSDTIYGIGATGPHTEELRLRPASAYDASKAAADLIARSYWSSYGLPVAVTRFANVYGGGDMNSSRLVPGSVWAALGGRRPVIRSDGTPRRDFLYVEDAVAAYLAIDRALGRGDGAAGEAFNAGGGRTHPIIEVVRAVFAAAGAPFDPDIRAPDARPGEQDRQVVDHAKLAGLTGWAPRVGLDGGARRTVDWYRRYAPAGPVRPGAV
jgi:CDP-glucose 4,6-dehydratase